MVAMKDAGEAPAFWFYGFGFWNQIDNGAIDRDEDGHASRGALPVVGGHFRFGIGGHGAKVSGYEHVPNRDGFLHVQKWTRQTKGD